MPVTIDAGDVIAGLAFLLSGYATWQTVSFNKRQKSLVESQEKLNKLLLEKENEAQKIISDNPQKISMLKKRYSNIDEETEFLN